MKKITLGGIKLENGVYLKPYNIEVYDGDLNDIPQIAKHNFDKNMFAASKIPTTLEGIQDLNSRLYDACMSDSKDKSNLLNISSNLLSGLYQKYEGFSCKDHAFYCLIKGVKNFNEEHAKAKMKTLYSHGLNEFIVGSVCEDVKKKYIPNYKESIHSYTKAQSLIGSYIQ